MNGKDFKELIIFGITYHEDPPEKVAASLSRFHERLFGYLKDAEHPPGGKNSGKGLDYHCSEP